MNQKIVIALNTAWNLANFRVELIRALVTAGYEVVAIAPYDIYAERLPALGCRYVPLPMDNKGTNPWKDFLLFLRFHKLLRRERPSAFLGYTVKPNVYGSLAANALSIPVINNIAGLGTVFVKQTWLTQLVRSLYRLALRRSSKVFFQNEEDRQTFISSGLVRAEITERLPGSGVDLVRFAPAPLPSSDNPCFLLISRMLWDKGVGEFVDAARTIKKRFPNARLQLLGPLDVLNPTAIKREQIDAWASEGIVEYLGETDDVVPFIRAADCVVLPSAYREGVPRTLLEAAAMARPIITTDNIGCRDAVEDDVTGFLCKIKDVADLSEKMEHFIKLTSEQRVEMGIKGRKKMEREFDEQIIIRRYLAVIDEELNHPDAS